MNNTLPIANGVDYWIQTLQTRLFNKFLSVWGIIDTQWNSYGRVYINKTDDGYIPEIYIGTGYEYTKDLFFNDTVSVQSFFAVTDPEKVEFGEAKVNVQLLFFVDLSQIKPNGLTTPTSQQQRLDEVFINDIENFIRVNGIGNFNIKAIYKRVDKVLEYFSGKVKRDALNYDMQPKLAVRFDLTFSYNSFLNN